MKKLMLLLVLSFFFLLIYATSEPVREFQNAKNGEPLPSAQPIVDPKLRTCAEDEFNCGLLDEDLTTCVKKFRICNGEVRCSNQDQIECPLCAKNFIYCDLYTGETRCVELKRLCPDVDQLTGCSANRTNIENECEMFKLSQPNRQTTTQAIPSTEVASSTGRSSTSQSPLRTTTEDASIDDLLSSTTESSSLPTTTTETTNSIAESSTDPCSALSSTTEFSVSSSSGPVSSTERPPTSPSSAPSWSTTKKSGHHGPHNIMDYSRLFKSDYGGFNFSEFIYKGNSKGGQLKPGSFFDYSKFMGGQKTDNKAGGFDFRQFMAPYVGNDGFNFSKYMSGYSKYMGAGQEGNKAERPDDFSGYMAGGQTNADGKPQAWGADKFDYSAYQKSGLNNKDSKGAGMYANDIKSGQKNQDKYAKGYFDQSGGNKTGYDSYYSGYVNGQSNETNYQDYSKYTANQKGKQDYSKYMANQKNNQDYSKYTADQASYQDFSKYTADQNKQGSPQLLSENPSKKENRQAAVGFDYSKYIKQYASGGQGSSFDYSKYYSKYMGGSPGGRPDLKGGKSNDLIRMTGSRQPTKSMTSWYDYSKYLKPGGNQLPDSSAAHSSVKKQLKVPFTNLRMSQAPEAKKTFHKAPYIANFKSDIVRMQEANQRRIQMQADKELGEAVQEPVRYEQKSADPILEREGPAGEPGYHHIEMQNQVPQYQPTKIGKEPSVNVSKILPNLVTNKYNYTHYGSGVFFINFGTIVNGRNNVVGSANDIGNGNANGNLNGNTQGDNMRPMAYDMNNQGKPAGPSPASPSDPSSDSAEPDSV